MTSNQKDYLLLLFSSLIYLWGVYSFQTKPLTILISSLAFGLFYIAWGIFHELRRQAFHARTMLEYLLIALLGVALVSTLLI